MPDTIHANVTRGDQIQTVSLSFFRFPPGFARIWAFGMMAAARLSMPRVPGIGFWKLCGSGTGEGFTPIPNTGVYAILATWPDLETARRQTAEAAIYRRYHARATEAWTVFLAPVSARGAWSGTQPFIPSIEPGPGPLAAITRATVRPRAALRFWGQEPAVSASIGRDPNVRFKIGIGEVPWVQQVTVSIWPDKHSMDAFARTGAHAEAIRAVREGGWFREELYARFRVLGDAGTWEGQSPLTGLETAA